MNSQEQEHWDYEDGCQSEAQNAYQRSRQEIDLIGDRDKIAKLSQDGKWVLIHWQEKYCPSTDAFLADVPHIHDYFDTEIDAKTAHNEHVKEFGLNSTLELRSPKPKLTIEDVKSDIQIDDIPF